MLLIYIVVISVITFIYIHLGVCYDSQIVSCLTNTYHFHLDTYLIIHGHFGESLCSLAQVLSNKNQVSERLRRGDTKESGQ